MGFSKLICQIFEQDEDIGNFQGWESVVRRLKDGRQVLKEYAEFLKQRAAIEEQVGKSLVKLAKSVTVREDLEPLRDVWEVMKSQTETSGLAHLKSAHQLSAELNKINEMSEQCRDKRRLKEESVRNHQQNVKVLWKRASEAKRIYELKCREEVASNQFYHQEVARCGKSSKEAEKVHVCLWCISMCPKGQLFLQPFVFVKSLSAPTEGLIIGFMKLHQKSSKILYFSFWHS